MPHLRRLRLFADSTRALRPGLNCGAPPVLRRKTSTVFLRKLGIVPLEQLLQGGGSSLLQGMDSPDQAKDVGSHNRRRPGPGLQNVSGVPRGTRMAEPARFDFVFAGLYTKSSFQHVPCFVVVIGERDAERSAAEVLRDRRRPATQRPRKNRLASLKYFPQGAERALVDSWP